MPCCKKKNKTLLEQAADAVAETATVEESTKGGKKKWLLIGVVGLVAIVVAKALKNNAESQAWQSNYKPSGS